MNYWLIKSEAECYSIDDLKKDTQVPWTGIRNFQARNYMRDGMKVGDRVLFYHSNGTLTAPSGVYGTAEVVSAPHEDETAFDTTDEHYDAKALRYKKERKDPMWMCVDMKFVSKLKKPISLETIKKDPDLRKMLVAKPGQRLSVMPVEKAHFDKVVQLSK